MISRETIERSIHRVALVGLIGMAIVFVNTPVDQLLNPREYGKTILLGLLAGFIAGVQKAIKGYIKYDRKTE